MGLSDGVVKHNAVTMLISKLLPFLLRLAFCLAVFSGVSVVAAAPLKVGDLAVWQAVGIADDIAAVSAAERQAQFRPLQDVYAGGFSNEARWLRFTVQVPAAGAWWLEVQPAILDDVRLYIPQGAGFAERRSGDRLSFAQREEPYRAFVFKLNITDTQPQTFYLRLSSSSTLMAQLRLWQADAFHDAKYAEYAMANFIGGVLFMIFCINVLLWYFLRLNVIAWFSLHVLTNLVLVAFSSGLAGQFVFPNKPDLAQTLGQLTLPLLLSASAPLLKSLVIRHFQARWLDRVFQVIVILPLIFGALILGGLGARAVEAMLVISLPFYALMAWVVLRVWRQTGRTELYLWPGALFTVLGGALSTLVMLGWVDLGVMPVGFFRPGSFGLILAMQVSILMLVHRIDTEKKTATERAIRAEMDVQNERKAVLEQSRFIGMITHELKTPLAVIDAATQSLERAARAEHATVSYRYDRIRRAVQRIERLVDQFLSADQIDHVHGQLKISTFDAARLLKGVADASLCAPERIHLQLPEQASLSADAAQMRIALANLVDNAIKYSPADSPIHLSLRACSRNGCGGMEFVVADEGPGVPVELRDRIFSRYTRGEDVGHISGAGLGLYLVQRIVAAHQGTVTLQARSTLGAAFHVWLPMGSSS
jgi:signal transduction histidine kinase